jgi:hypothetical protein
VSVTDVITTVINLAALIFLGAQVMLARSALRETAEGQEREWGRQRKKAAIDAIVASAQYRESLKSTLPWNDMDPKVMADFFEKAKGDYAQLAPLSEYLNHLEDLAVGVKQGVFDLETVSMLEGSRLIGILVSYAPYIEDVRREQNRPTIWNDLDDLVELIKMFRQGPTVLGAKNTNTLLAPRGWSKPKPAIMRLWATSKPHGSDDPEESRQ